MLNKVIIAGCVVRLMADMARALIATGLHWIIYHKLLRGQKLIFFFKKMCKDKKSCRTASKADLKISDSVRLASPLVEGGQSSRRLAGHYKDDPGEQLGPGYKYDPSPSQVP